MVHRKKYLPLLAVSIIVLALLAVFVSDHPKEDEGQLANPASVFCEENNYTLDIRTSAGGQYGVCMFPDGSECDEWAFFRGECSIGNTGCIVDADCVPASCCHPAACAPISQAPDCSGIACTLDCRQGTMDCGQGQCVCTDGTCGVAWS